MTHFRFCSCNSGREKYPKYDGHGIFLTYVCSKCEDERMKQYRPDIMTQYEADEPIDDDEVENLTIELYDADYEVDGELDDDTSLHYEDGAVSVRYKGNSA